MTQHNVLGGFDKQLHNRIGLRLHIVDLVRTCFYFGRLVYAHGVGTATVEMRRLVYTNIVIYGRKL